MSTRLRHPARRISCFATQITVLLACLVLPASGEAAPPCGEWDLTPTPNVGNSVTRLTAVTALSASDAWSVGYWRSEPTGRGSLALHWNGAAWSDVSLPSTGHLGTFPETVGVEATADGDVWLVGSITTNYPTNNLPLALRWRNGAWDRVETVTLRPMNTYPFAARGGFFYEVDAIASDDVWAVGVANGYGDASSSSVPLAAHWDGSSWTDVPAPLVANRHHELGDVVAISHDDVWAVGDYRNIGGNFHGITYHWDGEEWTHILSPIESMGPSGLEDIVATGPNDVWAIGGADGAVILMHWDGSEWSLATPPPDSGGSLAAVGPSDLWASGWNGFWHWDGVSWTEVPATVPGASYVIRNGGMEVVEGCDVWSVGFSTLEDGITSSTLAERLQPARSAVDVGSRPGAALTIANPYRVGESMQLAIPAGERAVLTVHDLQGAVVRRIFDATSNGGAQTSSWNGRTDSDRPVPSGIYFFELEVGGVRASRKILVLD